MQIFVWQPLNRFEKMVFARLACSGACAATEDVMYAIAFNLVALQKSQQHCFAVKFHKMFCGLRGF